MYRLHAVTRQGHRHYKMVSSAGCRRSRRMRGKQARWFELGKVPNHNQVTKGRCGAAPLPSTYVDKYYFTTQLDAKILNARLCETEMNIAWWIWCNPVKKLQISYWLGILVLRGHWPLVGWSVLLSELNVDVVCSLVWRKFLFISSSDYWIDSPRTGGQYTYKVLCVQK